jgi:3-oxoacyl-[acyl-carrier protein] reductase
MKKSFLAIIFAALAIVACSKKEAEPAPAPAPTPAAEKPAESAPAPAAEKPAEPAPAPQASSLPAECEAYLSKVNACVEKLGAAGDAVKQGLETTREGWKQVPQEALGEACKQATEQFEQQVSKAMGC